MTNYVAAQYFSRQNEDLERIWLIHSEKTELDFGTKEYAENLKKVLEKEIKEDYPRIDINLKSISDISRAEIITEEIKDMLEEEGIEEVHLNYTGGTKAMAVHIYRALEDELPDHFSASYLDARYYQLIFDGNSDLYTDDLRESIEISWENLFRLHDLKIKLDQNKNGQNTPQNTIYIYYPKNEELNTILECIANMAKAGKLMDLKKFSLAKDEDISEKSPFKTLGQNDSIEKLGLKPKDIVDKALAKFNIADNKELFDLLAVFPDENRLVNEDGSWRYEKFPICSGNSEIQFIQFIEGKWFDAYIAWVLNKLVRGCEAIAELSKWGFEVDVLIKNGYQICGISCGTSSEKRVLKLKGLEVILRSRQLGGDEARAVVATLFDSEKASKSEQDLRAASGTRQQTVMVLGINDLVPETMASKIKEFLRWK